jgi:hypothetical protein
MKQLRWRSVGAGAMAFLVAHAVMVAKWTTWFGGGEHAPWFLNDGTRGVLFMMGCLFVATLIATMLWATGHDAIVHGVNVAMGAVAAMMIVLFGFVGPGTLFPIVIAGGAILAFLSTFVASVLVAAFKPRSARSA